MTRRIATTLALVAVLGAASALGAGPAAAAGARPPARGEVTVIGHRGASGYRPEHTLASYELAIAQCADFIEPDLVSTSDGVLVARHENEIGGTTDVASPEFARRRTTKVIDGASITGWFTEDFTFAELETLRSRERLPLVRPANTAFDGQFPIPSFQQVIDLARRSTTCDGRPVGIYPETKHPSYFDSIGLSLEEPLVATLDANGFSGKRDPVFIQSFELGNLRRLKHMTKVRLIQLVDCSGALTTPSPVIADAHHQGLVVHAWTFRRENQFLPAQFRSSSDPNAAGDLVGEIRTFMAAGLDGFFTDNPDLGVAAVG